MVKLLTKQKESSTEEEEELKLTLLMEQRLQCILLALAKLAGKFKGAGAKEYVQQFFFASSPKFIYSDLQVSLQGIVRCDFE